MDLEPYHGKRVKCWTYTVLNYPGENGVLAHLYIYKDKIVGGDISSTALDGFMHGLTSGRADSLFFCAVRGILKTSHNDSSGGRRHMERLDKLLASQGWAPAAEVQRLIRGGGVTVDGAAVRDPGAKCDPDRRP